MKVEFVTNSSFGLGKQLLIQESEYKKAAKDKDEKLSLFFAIHLFHLHYNMNLDFGDDEYSQIFNQLNKNGYVHFTVIQDNGCLRPIVYTTNNGITKEVIFQY